MVVSRIQPNGPRGMAGHQPSTPPSGLTALGRRLGLVFSHTARTIGLYPLYPEHCPAMASMLASLGHRIFAIQALELHQVHRRPVSPNGGNPRRRRRRLIRRAGPCPRESVAERPREAVEALSSCASAVGASVAVATVHSFFIVMKK